MSHKLLGRCALALLGQNPDKLDQLEAFSSTLEDPSTNGNGVVQKLMCKFAHQMFIEAGKGASLESQLYRELSEAPQWHRQFESDYIQPLYRAFARSEELLSRDPGNVKAAAALGVMSGALDLTPEVLKTLVGVGALGGGAVGGLSWLLNEHSQGDEEKAEAMKAKINHYHQITNEISSELARKRRLAGAPLNHNDERNTVGNVLTES